MSAGSANTSVTRKAGPANGVFPAGCKWRDLEPLNRSLGFWDMTEYEFWDDSAQMWSREMPEACLMRGERTARL